MAKAGRDIVVFDLGSVLIDWDPRHLYRKLFAGNYQIAAITALLLLVPSIAFMLLIERFLSTETLAKIG